MFVWVWLVLYVCLYLGWVIFEIVMLVVFYFVLLALMYLFVECFVVFVFLFVVLMVGFLLCIYMVFYDCVHGLFLFLWCVNYWFGAFCGVLFFEFFDCWCHSHVVYYVSVGDFDWCGVGDVITMIVMEYW